MKQITLNLKQVSVTVKIMALLCTTLFIACSSDDDTIQPDSEPELDTPSESSWTIAMGGDNDDEGLGIGTDLTGNVYTIGSYINTLNLQTKNGAVELTSVSGLRELFVQKVNSSGEILWAKSFTGTDYKATDFAVGTNGQMYITGYFKGTLDADPNTAAAVITSNGEYDIFILNLNSDGNLNWAKNIGGTSNDIGSSITVDNTTGNVYSTGRIGETVNFDPSNTITVSNPVGITFFTQKLNANGGVIWVKNMDFTPDESITVDGSGNIYRTGVLYLTQDFDPGAGEFNLMSFFSDQFPLVSDSYIQKLDTDGNFLWAKRMGSYYYEKGISIAVDAAGNVYSTGEFQVTVDFNPGAGTSSLTATGVTRDIYLQKLDPQGNFLWAKSFGSDKDNIFFDEDKALLSINKQGEIFLAGHYQNTFHGEGFSINSKGIYDIFIQKRSTDGNLIWTKSYGGTKEDKATAIAIDNTDNIYVTGYFSDTVEFGLDTNEEFTSKGESDMFIQKLN